MTSPRLTAAAASTRTEAEVRDARFMKDLVDALRPFAKEADEWLDRISDSYHPGLTEPRQNQAYAKAMFSMRDLRRARRLVKAADAKAGAK